MLAWSHVRNKPGESSKWKEEANGGIGVRIKGGQFPQYRQIIARFTVSL